MAATRPYNALCSIAFIALAAAGLWAMRIGPIMHGVPVGFSEAVKVHKKLANGGPLQTQYTTVGPIDRLLATLVAAFMPGAAGWEPEVRLLQIYLLGQVFPIVAIWNVEANRVRNRWRLVSFISLFTVAYQIIGGAVILPLYYLVHVLASAKNDYLLSGRRVPLVEAKNILSCVTLGYGVPTVLMYLPWKTLAQHQNWVAFWQPAPLFPGILLWYLSISQKTADVAPEVLNEPEHSSSADLGGLETRSATPKNEDVKHLKRLYVASGVVAAVVHYAALYTILTSADTRVSLSSVLLPNPALWKRDAAQGLHWLFQWDLWGCLVSSLVWAWLCIADVWRVGQVDFTATKVLKVGASIALATLLAGPGTAMAAVWYRREEEMVLLEDGIGGKTGKAKAT